MSKLEAHTVMIDHPAEFDPAEYPIATVKPAAPSHVQRVLRARVDSLDGRSQYVWVRLANGDLILGVYPQGETYCECEGEAP